MDECPNGEMYPFPVVQKYTQRRQKKKEDPQQYLTLAECNMIFTESMEELEKLAQQLHETGLPTERQQRRQKAVHWRQ